MNKLYKFFISSTYEDLKDERQEVIRCVLDSHNFPIAMEQFPASSLNQWEYIKKEIDTTDYYILIVGGKYGSIEPTEQISYTEKEFNYARKNQIPVIAFMIEDTDVLQGSKIEKDPDRLEKLNSFRDRLLHKEGILIKYFNAVQNLKYEVIQSIHQIINDNPRPGWVRADPTNVPRSTQNALGFPLNNPIDLANVITKQNNSQQKSTANVLNLSGQRMLLDYTNLPAIDIVDFNSLTNVLGHTQNGLTTKQIMRLFDVCGIRDISPTSGKSNRLYDAFKTEQRTSKSSCSIWKFIEKALITIRGIGNEEQYESLHKQISSVINKYDVYVDNEGNLTLKN